jgi:N-acetylneuraminic acid mutarotase
MRDETTFGSFRWARSAALVLLTLAGCSNGSSSSDAGGAPTISTQPASVTVAVGSAATFSVTATGSGLTYQWLRDGAPITGATSASYSTDATVEGDDGATFTVNVSDGKTSVQSSPATLRVDWVRLNTQPHSAIVQVDYGVTLSVDAVGSGALTYQWRKNGASLAGATGSTLPLAHIAVTDGGSYDCVITGQLDTTMVQVTSAAATLQLNDLPVITADPVDVAAPVGGGATFMVGATGLGTLSYLWRKNGTAIIGATASTLTVPSVTSADAGQYDCVVTSSVGTSSLPAVSKAATLTVVVAPATPVVTIAAQATAGKGGLTASTQDQGAGNTYTWSLTNGTITGGQGTRSITYTAGTVGTLTAGVTVMNLAGNASGSATETLIAAAPRPDLLCPSTVHPNDAWMHATITPSTGSITYGWTIVSGTANGSITSGQGTTTIGFSAGAATGSFQVQVNASNQLGDPTTASCTVQVQTGVWVIKDGGPTKAIGAQPAMVALPNGRVLVSGGQVGGSLVVGTAMIYSPATGTWFATAPMNAPRYGHTATVLPDGSVLVAGGKTTGSVSVNSAEIFDPVAGTWTPLASTLSAARFQHTATWLPAQGRVLLAGGSAAAAPTTADLYDPVAKTFTPTGSLNITRAQHTATLLQNGQVLIAGGTGGTGAVTASTNAESTLEIYDPLAGTFTQVTSLMQKPRFSHGASLLADGTVLITGGSSTAATFVTAEIFNLSTGPAAATTTLTANPLAVGRQQHSSTVLGDGRVLLVGGSAASGTYPHLTAEIYDPANGTFTATGSMQNGRFQHGVALLPDGRVMVAGGSAPTITSTNSVEVFDPSLGTWSFVGGQVIGRSQHTTTVLADGRVLVVGGQGAGQGALSTLSYLKSAQIYDPATSVWSSTGSLTTGRYDHTATLLSDGRVLVTGGNAPGTTAAGGTTNSAEIWDPSTGQWTVVASMTGNALGRRSHVATLLPNGNVLVTGGQDSATPRNYLASAEIYDPGANSWSAPTGTQPAMSSSRFFHTATLVGGKVVIIGGKTTASSVTSSVDSYDPATQSFTALTDIGGAGPTPRGSHTATLLANGKIFVAGGQIAGGISGVTGTNTTELYDPSTGMSDAMTPTMSIVRVGHTAVLVAGGKVLLTGGGSAASDLYDATARTITTTGNLIVSSSNAAAVLLGDGSVMVTGGASADANTELYVP